jgi:hypothetical protein
VDPYVMAYNHISKKAPPTMVAELLVPRLVAKGEEEHGKPNPDFVSTLRKCFEHFATTVKDPLIIESKCERESTFLALFI